MPTTFPTPDYVSHRDNYDLSGVPGRYGLPLVGDTFKFLKDPYSVLDRHYCDYGPVSRVSLTFNRMVLALGPEYIQELTLDTGANYSARMGYDAPLGDFFAGGLLMRDFAEHKFHRRIMQSAFKTSVMRNYVQSIHSIVDVNLAQWGQQADFHFYPHVKELLLDVAAKVFLGLDLAQKTTEELNQAFLDMMSAVVSLIRKDWPGLLYRRGMNGRRALEAYFLALVPERRGRDGEDMASFFANERTEDGEYFPDQVVAEHLIFLLLAAHDTTTSALTMAVYYLAANPEWQERLYAESQNLAGPRAAYDELGTVLDDTGNCFKETLRLHPPVPQFARRTIREVELGGVRIPAHTVIQASPIYTQRMEQWWTNPHDFDPDRFAQHREEHKQHPFLWAPFGGGAHKCIGLHFADMLFKCVLSNFVSQYRFRFADPSQYPGRLQHFPFTKTMDDLPLVLESR